MLWIVRNINQKLRFHLASSLLIFVLIHSAACTQQPPPSSEPRVILITGSTGGLGRETALALAQAGDHVIIHGRNIERAEEILQEIEEDGSGSASFYRADFASLDQTKKLANTILADYDRLDAALSLPR